MDGKTIKDVDSNVLSVILTHLDYKTLSQSSPFVCKKWFKAFHTKIVYNTIDDYLLKQPIVSYFAKNIFHPNLSSLTWEHMSMYLKEW